MRYFNGNALLKADSTDDGYQFVVEVVNLEEAFDGCVESLRNKPNNGYFQTLGIDWTDDEQNVTSTDELRIVVDTSELSAEEFSAWLSYIKNRPMSEWTLVPFELMPDRKYH